MPSLTVWEDFLFYRNFAHLALHILHCCSLPVLRSFFRLQQQQYAVAAALEGVRRRWKGKWCRRRRRGGYTCCSLLCNSSSSSTRGEIGAGRSRQLFRVSSHEGSLADDGVLRIWYRGFVSFASVRDLESMQYGSGWYPVESGYEEPILAKKRFG